LIQERGRKVFSKHFVIAYVSSLFEHSRLGVTVSVKVNKRAVGRNLLKRRVREVFRLNRYRLKENFDIVIIARRDACLCDLPCIRREVLGALYHNGLLI
jgi:ribonuclease P protein component